MDIKKEITNLMAEKNLRRGYSERLKDSFCFIAPSPSKYPFQWWLDTYLHVYILCALKEYELAKDNLRSLFRMQENDGFVGHMIYWERVLPKNIWNVVQAKPSYRQLRPHMSRLLQPCYCAQAVKLLYEETGDREFLNWMWPKIKSYHQWLRNNRDEGLLVNISPNETGFDFKPTFDSLFSFHGKGNYSLYAKILWCDTKNFLRRYDPQKLRHGKFKVFEVGFNTAYALDLNAMAYLAGGMQEDSRFWEMKAKEVAGELVKKCYSRKHKAFLDVDSISGRQLNVITPTVFYPLALPEVDDRIVEEILVEHLHEFEVRYPLPSTSPKEEAFNPEESRFIWRGPTWIYHNWFLLRCFLERGRKDLAKKMVDSVETFLQESGFREYYNPFTGEGYGARDFTWSGLLLDMQKRYDGVS